MQLASAELQPKATLFMIGDTVRLKDSCQSDLCMQAWEYIREQRVGIVKAVVRGREDIPDTSVVYAVEFPDMFTGGHMCQNTTLAHRGQFVSEQHLDIEDFEGSMAARKQEVVTIPNVQEAYESDEKAAL